MRKDPSGWTIRLDDDYVARYRDRWYGDTIGRVALRRAEETPDRTVMYLEDGTELSFAWFATRARQLAAALQARGLRRGDVVAFQLPNWAETAVINIACSMLGLVVCPIVPIYRDREVKWILSDARVRMMFIPARFRSINYIEMMQRLAPDLPDLAHVIVCRSDDTGSFTGWDALMAEGEGREARPAEVDPDTVKIVLYTSGTTGMAKAVLHTYNSYTRALQDCIEAWGAGADDVMVMPSPVTHTTGYSFALEMPFLFELKSAIMEKWDAGKCIDLIERVGGTLSVGATPFLQELARVAKERGTGVPGLRLFLCGGAAVPPEVVRRAKAAFSDCRPARVYGSTETPMITQGWTARDEDAELAATTDGEIRHWDVRFLDDTGQDVPDGSEGEIVARGPACMVGYGRAEHNEGAFTSDGWFRTGDLGYRTSDNAIVITGRKKDLIIRGGENLSAKEIEDALHAHPDIRESAVVAMPHERLGEGVCAFIIMNDPATAFDVKTAAEWLDSQGLARQKWPERVELVEDLPRTASGKVKKNLLREDIRRRLGEESGGE